RSEESSNGSGKSMDGRMRTCSDMLAESTLTRACREKKLAVFGALAKSGERRVGFDRRRAEVSTDGFAEQLNGRPGVTAVREIAGPEVQRLRVLAHGQKDPDVIIGHLFLLVRWSAGETTREQPVEHVRRDSAEILRRQPIVLLACVCPSTHPLIDQTRVHH